MAAATVVRETRDLLERRRVLVQELVRLGCVKLHVLISLGHPRLLGNRACAALATTRVGHKPQICRRFPIGQRDFARRPWLPKPAPFNEWFKLPIETRHSNSASD